jgi:hypothetical protein
MLKLILLALDQECMIQIWQHIKIKWYHIKWVIQIEQQWHQDRVRISQDQVSMIHHLRNLVQIVNLSKLMGNQKNRRVSINLDQDIMMLMLI